VLHVGDCSEIDAAQGIVDTAVSSWAGWTPW
jgi:hypothetical protein